jgi:quinol monooxygenase YgiN
MTDGFGLYVRFTLRSEEAATAFDALVAETLGGIKAHEPDTLAYVVHTVPDEPKVRAFYELYANRTAFEAHESQPHTKRFLIEREQYLSGVTVTFLTAQAGTGPVAA